MSKYRIKLDGVVYEMEIERIDGEVKAAPAAAKAEAPVKAAPAAAPVKTVSAPVQTGSAAAVSAPAAEGDAVRSPMPGTVLKINFRNGEAVKKNDAVLVLEAMKMENEIVAPKDGIIAGLTVEEKMSVQGGDVLFSVVQG